MVLLKHLLVSPYAHPIVLHIVWLGLPPTPQRAAPFSRKGQQQPGGAGALESGVHVYDERERTY